MIPKLNYYSKYNRVKEHHDIFSLYNLFNGLDLDLLVPKNFTISLPTSLYEDKEIKPSPSRKRINNRVSGSSMHKIISNHRRHVSCDHKGHLQKMNQFDENLGQHYRKEEEKEAVESESKKKKEPRVSQNHVQYEMSLRSYENQMEKASKPKKNSGGNSFNPSSLAEMDGVKQTESINSGSERNHKKRSQQYNKNVNPSGDRHQITENRGDSMKHKFSSIESLDVKKCSSHDHDSNNESCRGIDEPLEVYDDPLRDSSHHHREEDIYSEQFIEDIKKLMKLNDDDRKSTKEKAKQVEQLQHSKSQFLDRIHGSDIDMSERNDHEDSPIATVDRNQYPTTIRKKSEHLMVHNYDDHNKLVQEEGGEEQKYIEIDIGKYETYQNGEGEEEEQCENGREEPSGEQDQDGKDLNKERNEVQQEYQQQYKAEQDENRNQWEEREEFEEREKNSNNAINNLQEIKETQSEQEDRHDVQQSAVLVRMNFSNPAISYDDDPQRQNYLNPSEERENPLALTTGPTTRKSFKKAIRHRVIPTENQNKSQTVQNAPINFKQTRKLNPRLVTSTIVSEGRHQIQNPPQKKVNFKKALIRGQENRLKTEESAESRKQISLKKSKEKRDNGKAKESRKLLQAFFQQN